MALSNTITTILNFMALLCSIPIIGAGIWLATKQSTSCIYGFRLPIIILGALIFLVSLSGFAGVYWNRQCLLATYLVAMAILIVALLALLIFGFVVTRSDGGYRVDMREYREYRLEGFSKWLRDSVVGDANWRRIRKCLKEKDVCKKLIDVYATPTAFFAAHLTPLQSGCCKPPSECGYGYVRPTIWVNNPLNNNPMPDADCNAWSNDQTQLCYGCDSCKDGLLGSFRLLWRKANVALIIAAVVLISIYIIACSAFRNVQTEELFRRYKWGNP